LASGAGLAWLLFALRLFRGAAVRHPQTATPAAWAQSGRWLFPVVLFAATVRLAGIEELPAGLWYDEAAIGLEARRMLQDPDFRPMYSHGTTSPAAFIYLVAGAEALLGITVAAVRVVPALMGAVTVALAYYVAAALWGRWAGLVAALLFAVARWDINFSRIGMQGETTPLLTMAAAALLLKALQGGHPAAYAGLGLVLGASLWFYGATIFFLPLLVVGLVMGATRPSYPSQPSAESSLPQNRTALGLAGVSRLTARAPGLALTLGGFLLVAAPVFTDAAVRPQVVFSRAEVVSVFRNATPMEALPAIRESLRKHLVMFHLEGDQNGRHNLPGAPMLDWGTGVLMLLGLVSALRSGGGPAAPLLPAWLFLMVLPGVFSLPFEAPQGLRAIGALPPALLLAALGMDTLRRLWVRPWGQKPARWLMGAALFVIASLNLYSYFRLQASDPAVWNAFSMGATVIGQELAKAGPGDATLVSVFYQGHPTVGFFSNRSYTILEPSVHLPLSEDRSTTITMAPEEEAVYLQVRTYYPTASCREVRRSSAAPPVLFVCSLTASAIREAWGLRAGAGSLHAPAYGPYKLGLDGPRELRWTMDGRPMGNGGDSPIDIVLTQGLHSVEIQGPGEASLWWQPPGGGWQPVPAHRQFHGNVLPTGLTVTYHQGRSWQGTPALQRIEPGPAAYYHVLPLPLPYSVEWIGTIHAPTTGLYRFSVEAISEASLEIDGQPIVMVTQHNVPKEGDINLTEGWHTIRVRYLAAHGYAHVFVRWFPPGGRWELIPPNRLRPRH